MLNEQTPRAIDSLRGFEFPVACNGLAVSPDGNTLLAVGTYKPSVKLFTFQNMSMKFERHCAEEPLKCFAIDESAEKFGLLRADRSIEFHTRNGLHETIKVPNLIRDALFNRFMAEVYICGDAGLLHVLDLEEGRFRESIQLECSGAYSVCFSSANGIMGVAADDSAIFIDPRVKDVFKRVRLNNCSINGIAISGNGMNYSISTVGGLIHEFDIRSDEPIRDEKVNEKPKGLRYVGKYKLCASGNDLHIFDDKWNRNEIKWKHKINTFEVLGSVVFVGGETPSMESYHIDGLGPVSAWFTDNIV